MFNLIANPEDLEYTKISETEYVAKLGDEPCEMKVYLFKKGHEIPKHKHDGANLKVVLKGEVEFNHGVAPVGAMYACGSTYYGRIAKEDTYVLVLQDAGTKRILA